MKMLSYVPYYSLILNANEIRVTVNWMREMSFYGPKM
jgi:hypothetical protein